MHFSFSFESVRNATKYFEKNEREKYVARVKSAEPSTALDKE
jgi:hypothetical protein